MAGDLDSVALEELPCACFIVGRDGRVRQVNARAGQLLRTKPVALVGREVLDLYADTADGRPQAQRLQGQFLAGQPIDGEVVALRTTDGEVVWGQLWVQPVVDAAGRTVESRSLVFDVTAQRRAEAAQRRTERRFRAAFDDAPVGTALLDEGGRMLAVNSSLVRLTGAQAAVGQPLVGLIEAAPTEGLAVALTTTNVAATGELPLAVKDGTAAREPVWVRVTIARLGSAADDEVRFIAHLEDVTDARRLREQLQHAAVRDPLTGLLNRRGFAERGREILAAADRHQRPVALLFLDVDRLKQVNDQGGHAAGDRLLVEVAQGLRQRFRQEDQIARWGGDEFCVLLDDTDQQAMDAIVAEWTEHESGPSDGSARVSVGHAVRSPGSHADLEQLIDEADRTMYERRAQR